MSNKNQENSVLYEDNDVKVKYNHETEKGYHRVSITFEREKGFIFFPYLPKESAKTIIAYLTNKRDDAAQIYG